MTLKEARARKLLTIRGLADAAGVSVATVTNTEQGKYTPSLRVVQKLAKVLEVDPMDVDEFRASIEAASRGKKAS